MRTATLFQMNFLALPLFVASLPLAWQKVPLGAPYNYDDSNSSIEDVHQWNNWSESSQSDPLVGIQLVKPRTVSGSGNGGPSWTAKCNALDSTGEFVVNLELGGNSVPSLQKIVYRAIWTVEDGAETWTDAELPEVATRTRLWYSYDSVSYYFLPLQSGGGGGG